MGKPLIVDLPYPDLTGIEKDPVSAGIIRPAYGGGHGEITAILQYVYHSLFFDCYGESDISNVLTDISIAEMKHLDILGEMLLKLGSDPVYAVCPPFYEFYSTEGIAYSKSPQNMLLDDIAGEMKASAMYGEMAEKLCNEKVIAVIKRIRMDEELHIAILKEQLKKLKNRS